MLRRFVVRSQIRAIPLMLEDTYVGTYFETYQECWDEFYARMRANIFGSPYFEFESGLRENAYPILNEISAPV